MAVKNDAKMALWEQVKTTPPSATKTSNFDGREITSINGMYMVQRATEMFGPIGKGWGFKVVVDRFDQGAPITDKNGAVIAWEQMHTIQIELWYAYGGKRNTVTQFGHTPFVRKSQFGPYTDFDACKKSLTDAMKKCLSLTGFSADIYLGMFEDPTYVEGLKLIEKLEGAGGDGTVMDEAKENFKSWLRSQLEAIAAAPNVRALDLMCKQICEKARAKAEIVKFNPSEIESRITEASDLRLAELTPIKTEA